MTNPTRAAGPAPATPEPHAAPLTVSRPQCAAERQADRAAATVVAGGSVAGWSFLDVSPTTVHREDGDGAAASDDGPSDELLEAAETTARALLETEAGQALIERIRRTPLVRQLEAFATSPAGIGLGVGLGAAAVGVGVGATVHRRQSGATRAPEDEVELPLQMPDVPLDFITPGLSGRVAWEGPVDAPTNAGIVLTYRPTGPEQDPDAEARRRRQETAALARDLARWREATRTEEDRRAEQAAIARWVAARTFDPSSPTTLLPLDDAPPREVPTDRLQLTPPSMLGPRGRRGPSLLPDEQLRLRPPTSPVRPVLRETASGGGAAADTARVDAALRRPGRPLPSDLRGRMEARFGWRFDRVRVHADPAAATAARDLGARAFTSGRHIGFAAGAYAPATARGRRTLAHELAHVVQQHGSQQIEEVAP